MRSHLSIPDLRPQAIACFLFYVEFFDALNLEILQGDKNG
uniref:Uncharacterized protein n=1 Tax=Trichinella nativa TaxID=6335 RepID=A0A0V1KHM9_9BILA